MVDEQCSVVAATVDDGGEQGDEVPLRAREGSGFH